jgi:hypothetical protein
MTGKTAFNSIVNLSANPTCQKYFETPDCPQYFYPGEVLPQPGLVGQVFIVNEQYFTCFCQKITGVCKKMSGDVQIVPDSPVKGWVTDDPVEAAFQV